MQLLHKYFNPFAELVILIGIPTKEAKKKKKKRKKEMETDPVTVEIKICNC